IDRIVKEWSETGKFPFGIYPDSVGLLPIGTDSNGGTLYYHTGGMPDEWPVIANPPRYFIFERFELSLTSFLAKCFNGETRCVLWGEDTFAAALSS
ncbi:MAG TPA: hypothetical protein VFA26_10110, partial [Gemmataceae bacterium]|nr:hypothetical protein [Gemmataceae bacterium]